MKLSLRSIFRCMMEDGYCPEYEKQYITFCIDDNIGVVGYEEGILFIRIVFSIDKESYEIFLEASNIAMQRSYGVKAVTFEESGNIMFSCEFPCNTESVFRKSMARGVELLREAIKVHKEEMKRILLADSIASHIFPAQEDISDISRTRPGKIFS